MQTYIVCFAVSSCDSDWKYLDTLQAESMETALDKAVLLFPAYSRADLIALPDEPEQITVHPVVNGGVSS